MEVLLDSNFIISCIKKKISFIEQLKELGFKVILPREVFQELKDLRLKVAYDERNAIDLALNMFQSNDIKKMKLGNENVDSGLIAKGRNGYYIATLDAAIKRVVPNRVVISNSQQALRVERS